MSAFYEFDQADAFTSGAIGEPGSRLFVIQVRADGQRITMKCEKQQVAALAQYMRQLLADAPDADDRPIVDAMQLSSPIDIEFVVGTVGIAYDSRNDRMVVQIEELVPTNDNNEPIDDVDPGRVRVQMSRGQAAAFCEHSDDVVAAGRPPCIFCGHPIDLDGHACPRMN